MRQHYLFAVGTFAVGIVIGVLTVLSSSPVVSVVVPLLFGLIAGASGFYLAREDITQNGGRARLAFTGVCVSSLCAGLILALATTFWVRGRFYPKPLQELTSTEQTLSYEEQMRAVEMRAVARMLGADPREQAGIVRAAILDFRAHPEISVESETVPQSTEPLIEALGVVAALKPIPVIEGVEPDDYSINFNAILAYSRMLVLLNQQKEGPDTDLDLWRNAVSDMITTVGALVGSGEEFSPTYFLRLSDENPGALVALMRLRALGAKWIELTPEATIVTAPQIDLLPQGRAELIKLLQGGSDAISASETYSLIPNVALNTSIWAAPS